MTCSIFAKEKPQPTQQNNLCKNKLVTIPKVINKNNKTQPEIILLKSEINGLRNTVNNSFTVLTWFSGSLLGVMALFTGFAAFLVIREDKRVSRAIKNHEKKVDSDWRETKKQLKQQSDLYITQHERKLNIEIKYITKLAELKILFDHGEQSPDVIFPLITDLANPLRISALPVFKRVLKANISAEINTKIEEALQTLE